MGPGQQAGLKPLFAPREGHFEVQRADQPVLGGAERKVNHGRGDGNGLAPLARQSGGAGRITMGEVALGVTVIDAALHGF